MRPGSPSRRRCAPAAGIGTAFLLACLALTWEWVPSVATAGPAPKPRRVRTAAPPSAADTARATASRTPVAAPKTVTTATPSVAARRTSAAATTRSATPPTGPKTVDAVPQAAAASPKAGDRTAKSAEAPKAVAGTPKTAATAKTVVVTPKTAETPKAVAGTPKTAATVKTVVVTPQTPGGTAMGSAAPAPGAGRKPPADAAGRASATPRPASPAPGKVAVSTPSSSGGVSPKVGRATGVSVGAGAPAAAPQVAVPLEDHVTYQYNALGRRDPFQSLMEGEFVGADVGGNAPPDAGGLKVVGIVWGESDQFAMAEDVRGNSHVLRRGDRVQNGYVESLRRDALVVSITVDGQSESVAIPITRKGDKSNANR